MLKVLQTVDVEVVIHYFNTPKQNFVWCENAYIKLILMRIFKV